MNELGGSRARWDLGGRVIVDSGDSGGIKFCKMGG